MKKFVPAEVDDGMYYKCGTRIYPYPKFPKFNKVVRHVHARNPTGVTPHEIINMSVDIQMRVKNTMNYKYKNYDPTKWKLYTGG